MYNVFSIFNWSFTIPIRWQNKSQNKCKLSTFGSIGHGNLQISDHPKQGVEEGYYQIWLENKQIFHQKPNGSTIFIAYLPKFIQNKILWCTPIHPFQYTHRLQV
jgi:hypothetical protein